MTQYRMGLVGLFQPGDFFRGQFYGQGGHGIFEVAGFAGADDRGGDGWFGQHPGQGDLSGGKSFLGGELIHALDDLEIIVTAVEGFSEGVRLGP